VTYAFLVALLGAAGLGIAVAVLKAQRDSARRALADEHTKAMIAAAAWLDERNGLQAALRAKEALHRSHFDEFSALVERCSDRAAPLLLPWIQRVLQGAGSPTGVRNDPDSVSTDPATPGARGRRDTGKLPR
jgi:hypothetical protein